MNPNTPNSDKTPPPPDTVRPHVYDGIQEYDNRLPNWWLWTLYLAIIFSFLYWFVVFQSSVGESDTKRLEAALGQIEEARLAQVGELNSDLLWQMSKNPTFVDAGRKVYMGEGTCFACHGANLEGGVGVSLADHEWKWGNTPMSVYEVISEGSPDRSKGMVPWKKLGPEKVKQLTAFILSYHSESEMIAAPTLNAPIGGE